MFYVSSVVDENCKIGVTDTDDGVENFFTNKELVRIVYFKKVKVYGAAYYNSGVRKVICTILEPNQVLSIDKLEALLKRLKDWHNRWTGYPVGSKLIHPVENYLAMCVIGSKIIVNYILADGFHQGTATLVKLDTDKWKYTDNNNTMSDTIADSIFAAQCLSNITSFRIRKIQVF